VPKRLLPYICIALLFTACHAPVQYQSYEYRQYSVHETAADPQTEKMIAPYRSSIEEEMNEVIGFSETAMPKVRGEAETVLGNFVADLVLQSARQRTQQTVDLCVLNDGGFRTSLPQGAVTRGNVFELMPFENELVILTLSYPILQKLLNYIAQTGGQPVSGLRMTIRDGKPADVTINGQEADPSGIFRVVTSDYLANGGDNMSFLSEATSTVQLSYKLRDAIIDHILSEQRAGRKINAALDQRIHIIKQ